MAEQEKKSKRPRIPAQLVKELIFLAIGVALIVQQWLGSGMAGLGDCGDQRADRVHDGDADGARPKDAEERCGGVPQRRCGV